MKIRPGFVSNSSSSNFLIIAPVADYDRIIQELTDYEREIISKLFEDHELLGQKVRILCEEVGTDVPETLDQLDIDPKFEIDSKDYWSIFDRRRKAFDKGIRKFDHQPGVIFKEVY